jgi:integrase
MPREKTGSIIQRKDRPGLWALYVYKDELGKARVLQRRVTNITEGKTLLKKWAREIEQHGSGVIDGDKMTFAVLAEKFKKAKVFAPVVKDGRKVAGLRSHESVNSRIKLLIEHFGKMKIKAITHAIIEKYKLQRLETVKIATANRELQQMRGILNYAKRQGWLARNPFEMGEQLIVVAHEDKRDRVLSRDEEEKLLAACTGTRAHLRPIVICALDTGMRRGELLKLCWKDVDLAGRLFNIRGTITKTEQSRTVGITERMAIELQRLWSMAPDDPEGLVFGIKSDFKKGLASAMREAGIQGYRFHDGRHTATTRLVQNSGLSASEVMKITGHTQTSTFLRYVNPHGETAQRAAMALDDWHSQEKEEVKIEFVN